MSRQGQTGLGPGIMSSTPHPPQADDAWKRSLIDMHYEESPLTVGSGLCLWNDAEDVAQLLQAGIRPVFDLASLRV